MPPHPTGGRKPPPTVTPHKGGRSIKKSTDVTPETARTIAELKKQGVSLGDLVEWAVKNYKL